MRNEMISVGIDLGTSTTQMVLSKLTIKNMASAFTIPRVEITDKEIIYKSDIIFTPLIDESHIDVEKIKEFLVEQYQKSGFKKEDIQIGAVIITGETARKDNSENVLQAMSGFAGDFVVATAGPDLESIIAGKGSGAQKFSQEHHTDVVNFDIGGGTTNLSAFHDGDLVSTSCFDVGGRVIKLDPMTLKVTAITPKIQQIIAAEGLNIKEGAVAPLTDLERIADILAQVIGNMVGHGELSPYYQLLITNKGLDDQIKLKELSFSGGVADCILKDNRHNPFEFGDIGILLGRAIRQSPLMKTFSVIESEETIRATVVGAGSHTANVSGSTITYNERVLPLKNIPVLKLSKHDEVQPSQQLSGIIAEKIKWYQLDGQAQVVALAIEGLANPSFQEIAELAETIKNGLAAFISKKMTIVIVVAKDNAKSLGQALLNRVPQDYPLVCVDSLQVDNGDYIDIGKPVIAGSVLPVVIKTLVFE